MIAAGSADFLGPSTRKALTLAAEGVPTDLTGRTGATNGAAMRVAPVGIVFPHHPLDGLIDAVVQTGHVTHNTTIGIAGAAAVAAAVSAGVGGASMDQALRLAVEAARLGARRGFYFAGADVATRIAWAMDSGARPDRGRRARSHLSPGGNRRRNARGRPRGDGHMRDRAG